MISALSVLQAFTAEPVEVRNRHGATPLDGSWARPDEGRPFGFDRIRDISTKSATEIAEAAKAWGQNDDITVVTVRRAP